MKAKKKPPMMPPPILSLVVASLLCRGARSFSGFRPPPSSRAAAATPPPLAMALGDYSVELSRPLGLVLQERDGGSGGVRVKEVAEGGAAASAPGADVVPGDVLLNIGEDDVSELDFDSVMDRLTSLDEDRPVRLTLGDGLGQMDMPKNIAKQLKTNEEAFFIDAVVRQAVRELRKRNNKLGDLLRVDVIIGAGGVQDEGRRGQARFFAIFSTDRCVTSYSCNVSTTGIRQGNGSIEIESLSATKDEGLGQTYQLK
ncbi:hypothetical protein ACHAWF_001637 [Thalassiosira exigua]